MTASLEQGRWQMNRVGLLNFWYYDEEEFQLDNGRIILRGANGSGKSVTMQSFLPLVLDGDKRAHRLDPFGSRDRRIEYYLLGEEENGTARSDSTGYLWMEFKHGATGLYRTIGIGLRARRNVSQVQFWGFMLEDGRRIGHDFWLYDRSLWLEEQTKEPLDRKELEGRIGSGGQVVQDQKAYQEMVNKQLFGFPDTDAFQDLLQLMIQLRSPKLSKDFKPTAIYTILHQALPPLMEEDLRPLSEVLEDMDQIADRLDELKRYRSSMEKLQQRYDYYNKFELLTRSDRYLDAVHRFDEIDAKVRQSERELAEALLNREEAELRKRALQDQTQTLNAERELLGKHEAIGKQEEYEASLKALQDLERQLERSQDKLQKLRLKEVQLKRELDDRKSQEVSLAREQTEQLDELEALAGEIEFAEHSVYHRYSMPAPPQTEQWREPWRRDLRGHKERLELALSKAVQEREAAVMVRDREIELGEASQARDAAERSRSEREKRLDEAGQSLKDAVALWQQSLLQMAFGEQPLKEAFRAISDYAGEGGSLEAVREPLLAAFDEKRQELLGQRMELERERKELLERQTELQEEKLNWEQSREPEPPRSEARMRSRSRLAELGGAPLYAACDFAADIGEEQRARIEEALERSGLLDAWIRPDGSIGEAGEGEEDSWLRPAPAESGATLADVLVADPPADSGLDAALIGNILRSLSWTETAEMEMIGVSGLISGDGSYRLGPLAGRALSKPRAAFIGKETRKRTRLLEITRLQQELERLGDSLYLLEKRRAAVSEAEQLLAEEKAAFPSAAGLEETRKELHAAEHALHAALQQEQRMLERFKSKSEELRRWQRELIEATSAWSRLRREQELAAALKSLGEYESGLSELASLWRQHQAVEAAAARLAEEQDGIALELEDETQLEDELDERRREQRGRTEALQRIIDELGLADVARRLELLRQELLELNRMIRELDATLEDYKEAASRADARLGLLREQVQDRDTDVRQAEGLLQLELGRGLVENWKSRTATIHEDAGVAPTSLLRSVASDIRGEYASMFEGRNIENITNRLIEETTAVRMQLTEYVLELATDEQTGRFLVWSMRNPSQPQSPQRVLQELQEQEEEQSALLSERDRVLFEEVILRSVGKAIRQRIHRAEQWVREMNRLMEERETSSGLRLKLEWEPKAAANEEQLDVHDLVQLLKRDSQRLREDEIDAMIRHFREQIRVAKQTAQNEQESLRLHLYRVLDYRNWFRFELKSRKGTQTGYRPLTDARFNVMSGGEKAMAMYIPLFAAAWSRYSDAKVDAPRLISLDEAFAGVDEENMRDMFKLLTDMGFDYMMTSQVLWGCYDTVPSLAIYEISRPKDVDFVTLFHYRWNGRRKIYVEANEPT